MPTAADEAPARGAYGLRLTGHPPRSSLLAAVAVDAPQIRISRRVGLRRVENHVDEAAATVPLIGGGALELDREPRSALITTERPLSDDELAHPYLAPIAAVHSNWLGRAPFHAGGIVAAGKAWGVIGERGAGKSTLLAAVAAAGAVVLADDLLVVEDGKAFAGPRTLDLRQEAAEWFGGTRELGVAGARQRWRLDLGPAPQQVPVAGWIVLEWADTTSVERSPGAVAPHLLAPARSVTGITIDPTAFLSAIARPVVEFRRPPRMDDVAEGAERLIESLASISS